MSEHAFLSATREGGFGDRVSITLFEASTESQTYWPFLFFNSFEMESLEEQLKNKCIHFTGIGNGSCKLGIKYKDVRTGPLKFPCVKPEITTCDSRKHHTNEDVRKMVDEIRDQAARTLTLLILVRSEIEVTKKRHGTISCECGGQAHWSAAAPNGHIWFHCPSCKITFNE